MRRTALAAILIATAASAGAPVAQGGTARPGLRLQAASSIVRHPGAPGAAAAAAMRHGPLPSNAAALARLKAAAARWAAASDRPGRAAPAAPFAPVASRSFQGIDDNCGTPPDTTSAVGPARFIEPINCKVGIYDKTSNTPLATDTLNHLVGALAGSDVFDPQIIWDPGTKRFYYAADDVVSASQNLLAFGFSKTATPSSTADFCKYAINYGSLFPDFPKLGDTKDFGLIGVNVFNSSNAFVRSDVAWFAKPPAGTTCPSAASFLSGVKTDVRDASGNPAFTPVPANQIDTSGTGYIIARSFGLPATFFTQFKVKRNITTGAAIIPTQGQPVVVPSYTAPANAPQSGTTKTLDTSDARPWGVVSAIDPLRGGVALWVQHTVLGGAGAEVRWHEVNPLTRTLFQSGVVTNATAFKFNGGISPDRVRLGSTKAFGSNMVLTFSSSSASTFPSVRVVSKVGAGAQSGEVVLVTSPSFMIDHSCDTASEPTCRWGDYAGATPDPAASPSGTAGRVWITNEWNRVSTTINIPNWLTWNAAITP
jgi:hypothetical protein